MISARGLLVGVQPFAWATWLMTSQENNTVKNRVHLRLQLGDRDLDTEVDHSHR